MHQITDSKYIKQKVIDPKVNKQKNRQIYNHSKDF